ncbi:aromatic acid exporter family protein [Salibacterium salarium]|uniref:Aromatic acid exporter family protein n=1 Tax=Salibacterium salarium TaxID=284579 RepID=A0A428N3Z4_9BACI|nr:aromatic acid exporter family protein [Salibacterium salarium]RSL33048.1 aromatic acid exporter family protein [Salibacterium salarium]
MLEHIKKIRIKFLGARLIKTGIAVYLAAFLCHLAGLPPAFSVITAIVTLEPTAASSIRKGVKRFPATLIGAALAVTAVSIFGQSAAAYAVAAVFTIYACNLLHLEVGTLVATLTAVAMIPVTEGAYFISFVERAGTTSIGLVVSALVNFSILHPRFSELIAAKNNKIIDEITTILEKRAHELCINKPATKATRQRFQQLQKDIDRAMDLVYYQREEWKYHRYSTQYIDYFTYENRRLEALERIVYHINSLFMLKEVDQSFHEGEKELCDRGFRSIITVLHHPEHYIPEEHYQMIADIDHHFWHIQEIHPDMISYRYHHQFSKEIIVFYVILSIHDRLEDIEQLYKRHKKKHGPSS